MARENLDQKLSRFKLDAQRDAEAMLEQRDKANEDMRFVNVDGGQWEDFLEETYKDRARLEFDVVSNYVNRAIGQWNENRIGVEFNADDADTSEEDADLLTSVYRADFRDGSGKEATDNAVNEAMTCGFGAFHIRPVYEDEDDPENPLQRIVWEPIHNAFNTVFFDRSARRLDKSDARHCTLLTPYTRDAFEEEFPGLNPISAYKPHTREWQNIDYTYEERTYVATRYEVVKRKVTAHVYHDLAEEVIKVYYDPDHAKIEQELRQQKHMQKVRERVVTRRHVEMSRFTGETFIEKPRKIAGQKIGVVPMYAFRSYADGKEWYRGVVRKLKDPARVINVQMSQVVETAASGGAEIPIFDRQQVEARDVQDAWSNHNGKAFTFIDMLRDEDDNIVQAGPLGYTKPPSITPAAATLLEFSTAYVREATGGAPQETLDPATSGKAIKALEKREDRNTSPAFDNIAKAIEHSGEVYQSLVADVYDTPRMVRTLSRDGKRDQERLFRTTVDEETGKIVEANTLHGKRFKAYADIGPQYESVREQTVEELKGVLASIADVEAAQQYIPAIVATIMDNASGIGLAPLKKMVRQDLLRQGLVKPETDEERDFIEQQSQPQPNAQEDLIKAATAQAEAEARNLDASSMDKTASAEKKAAETIKIMADVEKTGAETEKTRAEAGVVSLEQVRNQVLRQAAQGL